MAVGDNTQSFPDPKWGLTINGNNYDDAYRRIKYQDELNQVSRFELELIAVSSSNSDISKDNEIKVSFDGNTAYKGTIDEVNSQSGEEVTVSGFGQAFKLDSRTHTENFTGSNTDDILSSVVGSTVNIGTNTRLNSTDNNVDFRVDEESKLDAINRLAREYQGDWWMDEDGSNNDQINVDSKFELNSGNSVQTYDVFGSDKNAFKTNNREIGREVDKVVVKGYGDGDDQYVGSHPDSPPSDPTTFVLTDKRLLSQNAVDQRAEALYNDLSSWQEITVVPMEPNVVRKVGEVVTINDEDTGLSSDFRIVQVSYDIDFINGASLELVCNNVPRGRVDEEYQTKEQTESQTGYAQGNRNTINESEADISDSNNGTVVEFNVPKRFTEDATGQDRTAAVYLDYDVKDYKKLINASDATAINDSTTVVKTEVTDFGDVEQDQTEARARGDGGGSTETVADVTKTDTTNAGGASTVQVTSNSATVETGITDSDGWVELDSTNDGTVLDAGLFDSQGAYYSFSLLVLNNESTTAGNTNINYSVRVVDDGNGDTFPGPNGINMQSSHATVTNSQTGDFWTEDSQHNTIFIPENSNGRDYHLEVNFSDNFSANVDVEAEVDLYVIDDHKHQLANSNKAAENIVAYTAKTDGTSLSGGVGGSQSDDTLPNSDTLTFGQLDNNDLVLTKETTNATSVTVKVNGTEISGSPFSTITKTDIDITSDVTTPGLNTVEVLPNSKGYTKANVIVDHKIEGERS